MFVSFWVWYPWRKVKSQLETRPWRLQPGPLNGSWVLPRARSWVQVVCLGDGMRERGEWGRKEERANNSCDHDCCGQLRSNPAGDSVRDSVGCTPGSSHGWGGRCSVNHQLLSFIAWGLFLKCPLPGIFCVQVTSEVGQVMWVGGPMAYVALRKCYSSYSRK